MINHLEALRVAHGDLQHGNIIINDGKIHLIDYDGMYLPSISNLKPNEMGHVNYQHPLRSESHYDSSLDRFSSIVIYIGILALTIAPELWGKYDNSENILFKYDDFVNCDNSKLLADIIKIPKLAPLVERFRAVCKLNIDSIPTLDQFISGNFIFPPVTQYIPNFYVRRSQYPVFDASHKQEIYTHLGERVEVIGLISDYHEDKTRYNQPFMFLNFGYFPNQTFTLVLWSSSLKTFQKKGINPQNFIGQWVSVTGVIISYKNRPQMEVETPPQIQIIQEEKEAKARLSESVIESTSLPRLNASSVPIDQPITGKIPISTPYSQATSSSNKSQTLASPLTKKEADLFNKFYGNQKTSPGTTATLPAKSRGSLELKTIIKYSLFSILGILLLTGLYLLVFSTTPNSVRQTATKQSSYVLHQSTNTIFIQTLQTTPTSNSLKNTTQTAVSKITQLRTTTPIITIKGCARRGLNIRSGPGVKYPIIGGLYEGDCIFLDGISQDRIWVRTLPINTGSAGWIAQLNLKPEGNLDDLPTINQ
jgi:type II secretory pathway component PulJ